MGALEIKIDGGQKNIIPNEGRSYVEPGIGAVVIYDGDVRSSGSVNGNHFELGYFGSYAGPFEMNERFIPPIEGGQPSTRMVNRVLVTKVRG